MEKKFDFQIVTSENNWVGGGNQSTQKEIDAQVKIIKERLKQDGRQEDLIIFKAEKMEQYTIYC
jgi:hypothetical protein